MPFNVESWFWSRFSSIQKYHNYHNSQLLLSYKCLKLFLLPIIASSFTEKRAYKPNFSFVIIRHLGKNRCRLSTSASDVVIIIRCSDNSICLSSCLMIVLLIFQISWSGFYFLARMQFEKCIDVNDHNFVSANKHTYQRIQQVSTCSGLL